MTPFLQQVAQHYRDAKGLEDYCFVFPNRRSGQFFIHYLQRELVDADMASGLTAPHLMPCVTSVNELVAQFTATTTAGEIDMLFALYKAYCAAVGDHAQEFDRFIYWAQLIIGDFNDIDKSLTDAGKLYCNLKDLHDLSSNYLTPEVEEKVKRIFGDNLFTAFFDKSADAAMWQHGKDKGTGEAQADGRVKEEFMSLWNALAGIYKGYHDALRDKGLVSPGRQLRLAAEQPPVTIPYKKLVFVAFGVLSAAEVGLFDHFKREGLADFWWDDAGLANLREKAPGNPAVLLIDGYCKRFGAKQLDTRQTICPDISVVAVPSSVGQAKVVRGMVDIANANIETAIVLPDESLLIPLLHSLDGIDDLNVTLGYPLRSSGIVSLMHIVARMHQQATNEKGVWTYYREDVYDILSHPVIKRYFTRDAFELKASLVDKGNPFRITADVFMGREFEDLFIPAADADGQGRQQYIGQLLRFCDLLCNKMQRACGATADDDADTSDVILPLQQAFLVMYSDVLNQLKHALNDCGQALQLNSVFYLIDRLAAAAVVPFSGEPLRGLQVMGLLETRGLDFDNIVMLSANEGTLPRHRGVNSFIPDYIRRACGMSTAEQQEAVMAYNFYRLLGRAGSVKLVFDSSTQDTSPGEPSRYITQLEKVYGIPVKHVEMITRVNGSDAVPITVPNDGTARQRYMNGDKCLSASAINKFIMCPLQFYMSNIQDLNDDNEVSDFMDAGQFGTIIHDTLMDCYYSDKKERTFYPVDIEKFQNNELDEKVIRNIKRTYLHQSQPDDSPLVGEAWMLIDTIKSYVNFVLEHDKCNAPFTILECEEKHELPLTIGGQTFKFKYYPDRIDRLTDGTVRIVDYKTGSDATKFNGASGLPELFEPTAKDRRKAILQLMLYCYAYIQEHPDVTRIQPVIYKIKAMKESGVFKTTGSGRSQTNEDYVFSMDDPVAQDFLKQMETVISRLYNDGYGQAPQALTDKYCIYCRFVDFCRRTPHSGSY